MPMLLTRAELAAAFEVNKAQILRWQDDGMPVAVRGGRGGVASKFKLADVVRWRIERELAARGVGGERPPSLEAERAKLTRAQTEKAELELRVRRGQLAEIADVEHEWSSHVAAARAHLMLIPLHLVQKGLVDARREYDARALVEDALRDFAAKESAEQPAAIAVAAEVST